MKQFSKIDKTFKKEDFIYSEITALAYFNPYFFDFLNDERYKYTMNDSVLNNSLLFEFPKYNITFISKIVKISVEKDWEYLKMCIEMASRLKFVIPNVERIEVVDDSLIFHTNNDIITFRDKKISDAITLIDFEKIFKNQTTELYNNNIDSFINLYINHLKNYIKPLYLNGLNYFLNTFYEKYLEMNWYNFKNFKVDGLGYRNDNMPKLYYNCLADFCKDVIDVRDAFRDYDLMLSAWKDIKNNTLNKEYLLPMIKDKITKDDFIFILSKYYSLDNDSYFRESDGELLNLPSIEDFKKSFKDDYIISYKTNDIKDLIVCISYSNIDLRIKIGFGLSPYGFYFEIESINNKTNKKLG
jgi:hypothetical protein